MGCSRVRGTFAAWPESSFYRVGIWPDTTRGSGSSRVQLVCLRASVTNMLGVTSIRSIVIRALRSIRTYCDVQSLKHLTQVYEYLSLDIRVNVKCADRIRVCQNRTSVYCIILFLAITNDAENVIRTLSGRCSEHCRRHFGQRSNTSARSMGIASDVRTKINPTSITPIHSYHFLFAVLFFSSPLDLW